MNIRVNLGEQSYDIVLERGVLSKVGQLINLDRRVLIVTDDGVPKQYPETVAKQCKSPTVFAFPQGEQSKNFDTFQNILDAMLQAGFTRKDCVVAVGGGVSGDMAGFAASCYMRGIEFYNIPTTLLSQVDSSIGGKTAIDFHGVKNIIGAFYQPWKVIIDPDVLETLDDRQVMAGLTESIKMAATFDAELFELIENSKDLKADILDIIAGSLKIKRDVVEEDPKEAGVRKVLNFGHTIGHAIESFNEGKFLHGECVAMGMIPMSQGEAKTRIEAVLKKYNLPTEISWSKEELLPYIKHDKKMQTKGVAAVYVNEIGKYEIKQVMPEDMTW